MYTYETISKIMRSVSLTICRAGYNDLRPERADYVARWWEVYEDFRAQSYHEYPAQGRDCKAWSPAYRMKDDKGEELDFADLMVLDVHGYSADQAHRLMVQNNLAGLAHPTRSSTLAKPRSRIIFLMDRPVGAQTYRLLWNRLAREVFLSLTNPAHADPRQRYDQPHAVRRLSMLLRHDGNLLNVDGSLAEPSLAGEVLGLVCQAFSGDKWIEGRAPRNR